jgi:hypothetical protein
MRGTRADCTAGVGEAVAAAAVGEWLRVIRDRLRSRCDVGSFPVTEEAGDDLELDLRTDLDRAGAVGDLRAVELVLGAVGRLERAETTLLVERDHATVHEAQCTILEIGSSMMPVAPASLSAGINVLISDFATTASTA